MVILLPKEGQIQEIEAQLSGEWAQGVVQSLQNREVILTLPKYRFETPAIDLRETLSAVGMPNAFSRDADFFGIIEQRPALFISLGKVLHKAFIDVNEKKTEAAAVSVVVVTVEVSIPVVIGEPPVVMRVDRPFIFFIRDKKTNSILFLGRVMNPTQ